VPEGEESDFFHAGNLGMIGRICETPVEGKIGDQVHAPGYCLSMIFSENRCALLRIMLVAS
jgi:hypothetical protein